MEIFKNIGKAVGGAVNYVGEKNRRAAYLNRLRTVIRCEEKNAEKEYLALGRYYYNNLRDANNPVTEAHCAELDAINARLERTLNDLEKLYNDNNIGVIYGEDGPTAIYTADENTETEEITLDDVQEFSFDPTAMPEQPEVTAPAEPAAQPESAPVAPAEQSENDNLPFEG